MSIRILLAGGHRILHEGLRGLLAQYNDIEIAGEARDVEAALVSVRDLSPGIVLLEADMDGKGAEVAGRIRNEFPEVRVIAHSAPQGQRLLADMLRAGAGGYVDRGSGCDELVQAIRSVAAGRPYLGPLAADSLMEEFGPRPETPEESDGKAERQPAYLKTLTAREIDVLRLLATGKRVKEIARILQISVKTVESHRQNMMDKLEIHNAIELARYALREGLVSI